MEKYLIILTSIFLIFVSPMLFNDPITATESVYASTYDSPNCVNNTNLTSNYLNMECTNMLANSTGIKEGLRCDTDAGWFNVCVWLERETNMNSTSPTSVMVSSSQNGGQSYSNASAIVNQVNSSEFGVRNAQIGINQQFVYVSYEKNMGEGFYDPFLVESSDGGETFEEPVNISNDLPSDSAKDSRESVLTVDDTGKYMVTWFEVGPDGTSVFSSCGMC